MMKKLSLVMAFLGAPSLIILDEPLITLDEKTRKILLTLIAQTAAAGTMFLMSSHQLLDDLAFDITGTYCIENKTLTPCLK
jgi:ABC-2 type transport system ATP-binding protein